MKPFRTLILLIALALSGLYWPKTYAPIPAAMAMSKSNKLDQSIKPVPDTPVNACINLGGALEAPVEGQWGYHIRQEDLARIAEAGFDTVRLPVAWSEHAANEAPYTIPPELLARTDEIILAALEQDLNVILNVHHYWEIMSHPKKHMPRLEGIWQQLSNHYADWPEGLIFEFLNEPHKRMTSKIVDEMNDDLLALVRPQHPDRYIILSGGHWGGLDGMLEVEPPEEDERIIMSFHYYGPHKFTHQGASFDPNAPPTGQVWGSPKDRTELESAMSAAAHYRLRTGTPVFLGEFGVYADVPQRQRARWTREVRLAAEARSISWCYFDWATTFRIYDLDRERWVRPLRQALLP